MYLVNTSIYRRSIFMFGKEHKNNSRYTLCDISYSAEGLDGTAPPA